MLQAAIAGFILLGIYKFIARRPKEEDAFHVDIDWWMAFAFIFTPSVLIFFLSMFVAAIDANQIVVLIGYVLYFVIPFLVMKHMLDYPAREAAKLALVVPFVAVMTEIPFILLFSGA